MNTANRALLASLAAAALCLMLGAAHAQQNDTAPAPQASTEQSAPTASVESDQAAAEVTVNGRPRHWHRGRHGNDVVAIRGDSTLEAGKTADNVIAIMGDATSAGEVTDSVVAVMGSTRVTGPVGDAVVSIVGENHIDSRIGGDAVALLGNLELGPHAEVGGNVVVLGGELKRDPAAIVHGSVQNVMHAPLANLQGLRAWIHHALRYGRPLAFAPGLGWAWGVALGFLALYVLLALLFREGVERCMHTLDTRPGHSFLAALLALLLTPVLFALLFITVIGIAAVPFVGVAIFCATLFGKAAVLAWVGRRLTRSIDTGPLAHPAFGVLIGGLIALALYLVPVVGFIVYKLLGLLALGVVAYTLILAVSHKREGAQPPTGSAPPGGSEAPPAPPATPGATPAPDQTATPTPATVSLPVSDATTLPRAGFWIRMAALLLDLILISILLGLIQHHPGKPVLLALAVYGAVMWKLKGSTVGGIICGLKVVRVDGRAIDWPTAIVRALGCFLSLAVAGLGFFWIAFDEGRQGWHDKIAGTAVVRVPRGASAV